MKITDLLSENTISIDVKASSKEDVIRQAVALMAKSGVIKDVEVYQKGVFKREEESTTGIGEGIAIPHCKSECVEKPALAAMVIPDGVEYCFTALPVPREPDAKMPPATEMKVYVTVEEGQAPVFTQVVR